MDERPFPHRPLPQPPPSRRGFVVVGALAVLAAGAGMWRALDTGNGGSGPLSPAVSAGLRAAADTERALIASADSASKHAGSHGAALRAVRADHVQHLAAIEALIADLSYPVPASSPSSEHTSAAPAPRAVKIADVRAGETAASRTAAQRAAASSGRAAVLLASIAACEATHAELLA